jgi:multidrug efflux pump subunit AcrB
MMIAEVASPSALGPVGAQLERYARENLPGVSVRVSPLVYGPPVGKPIEVRLSGYDSDRLSEMVDALKAKLAEVPGTKNIGDDWGLRTKKLMVEIDQPRARLAGVSSQDIAISLQTNLSGIETTQFREMDKAIPIILRSVAADRRDIGKLEGLHVHAQATGRSVPLKQVADVRLVWEASRILRRQRARTVTVEADVVPGFTVAEVNAEIVPWLEAEKATWEPGYGWELGGEAEASAEANDAIAVKMPYALLAIVILLVMQFNSLRRPAIVLATLPLGLIGVVVGLLITGMSFGFMPLLGVIALFGIIINNAVVLLDRIKIEIDENGLSPPHAVVEAAQRRLRPILLTTATTMAGLVPLAMFGGPMFSPMAVVIIGGLAFATVLTLGVVPVLYVLMYRVRVDHQVLRNFAS